MPKLAHLLGLTVAVVAALGFTSILATGNGGAAAAAPVVTSDIELVMDDSYEAGSVATIAIKNSGTTTYKYNPEQQQCAFTYSQPGVREFVIPSAVHCDLPGLSAEIAPGQTVTLTTWYLDECTVPGFSCFAVRPLASGSYMISGSLNSVNGLSRAEFTKAVSITGMTFTSDVKISVGYLVSDPPSGPVPSFIHLSNEGQTPYTIPIDPGCYLRFTKPGPLTFQIPQALFCDPTKTKTLDPQTSFDPVSGWFRDECVEAGPTACVKATALDAGEHTISGGLLSTDKHSYAEFSTTLTILPPPSPTAKELPHSGGAPGNKGEPSSNFALLTTLGLALAAFGGFVASGALRRR